ncbi:MAG: thioredoxin domain-containing protein [Candidatus Binatia bacterium]
MNRLAGAPSPYLRQHAANPVAWWPWGDEAFEEARRTGRPIFLSIGYATCHWCHVMAHESFEDAAIAEILNRDFVAIKVDRERPDVDRVYMAFVQATTGSGGWPLSVWLTPSLRAVLWRHLLPLVAAWGRPSSGRLREVARAWRDDQAGWLVGGGGARPPAHRHDRPPWRSTTILSRCARAGQESVGACLRRAARRVRRRTEIPRPSRLLFLLREHARTGAPEP